MSVGISVGMLSELADLDPEGLEWYREYFVAVNELLSANGLPTHTEPETLPSLENRCTVLSYPYSFIHRLRRVYAHVRDDQTWVVRPPDEGDRLTDDPVVEEQGSMMDSHLLCHSDAEGFYIPIDFRDVLFDDTNRVPGCMVGSSFRLMDELVWIAPALGIALNGRELPDEEAEAINADAEHERELWIERIVWLSLFEAARLSIEHKTAICFS